MKKKYVVVLFLFVILLGSEMFYIFRPKDHSTPSLVSKEEMLTQKGVKLVSKESFLDEASILLDKGYSSSEINQIYEYMSDTNIAKILKNDYVDLKDFYNISNFDFDLLDRYKSYQSLEMISSKDAVTRVNLKLDIPFYSDIEEIQEPDSILVLVNKAHVLSKNYVPEDLVSIPSFPNLLLRKVAIEDFEALLAKASLDGVFLTPYSTYRSYDYQDGLYKKYLNDDPVEVVDTYSARPGHSEHQTGLAIDIKSNSHWYSLTDADYQWMQENSYQYGFIIRYPKDHSFITGYKEEPWHIRYIGKEHASKIHDLGITYDEYYDLYLTSY